MHPITDFVRGHLCRPPVEVQERAAFASLWETYDADVYHRTIKDDEIMQLVCLRIVPEVPDESKDRRQEMWVIQVNDRRDVGVYCTRNEWKQIQQSCEHATECGWATPLAQMVQDEHDKRHLQIAEQTTSDHFIKELRDPEYWRSISYQESTNNSLLAESIRLIE